MKKKKNQAQIVAIGLYCSFFKNVNLDSVRTEEYLKLITLHNMQAQGRISQLLVL